MAYNLTDSELRQVQLIQLEMLKEVDRICKKNDIKYNIIAGTLLGAVRHGGYIPWDDDADVALLRDEYEKFRIACEKDLDHSKYYFQDHRNTDGYRWGYGKLRRKDTLFLREGQEHMPYEQGIFIDIFPLDSVPQNVILRKLHCFHCFCIRKILWSAVGRFTEKSVLKRQVFRILSKIPAKRVFSHYGRMMHYWNKKQSDRVRILTFPTPTKDYGYLKKWYMESAPYSFENTVFCGIRDYDAYLSFKFGDYMQLPGEEDRKVHPVSKLKLL